MKKKNDTGSGFNPKPKRKLERHAKKDSKSKTSKKYKKPYNGQG